MIKQFPPKKLRVASEDTDRWIMDMQMTEWIYNFPLIIQPQVLSSTTHDLKENLFVVQIKGGHYVLLYKNTIMWVALL